MIGAEAALGAAGLAVDVFNNERNISSAKDINAAQQQWDQQRYNDQKVFAQDMMYKQFGLNTHSAREQMEFQREMSNTSYQRATADLTKAGLNPMLAYMKGGADTPSGSSGSVSAPGAPSGGGPSLNVPTSNMQGILKNNLSTAMDLGRFSKDMEQKNAEIGLTKAGAFAQQSNAVLNIANAKKLGLEMPAFGAEAKLRKETADIDLDMKWIDAILDRVRPLIPFTSPKQQKPQTPSGGYPGQGGGVMTLP